MIFLDNMSLYFEKMSGVLGIIQNKVFVLAISAQFFSMVTKGIIKSMKNGKFSLKKMADYGGMPSSHTAFIVAALIGVGLEDPLGFASPLFGFASVIAFIILVDAVKFRGNVDKINGNVTSIILNSKLNDTIQNPKFIAHKIDEVIGGIIFAVIYSFVFYSLFNSFF